MTRGERDCGKKVDLRDRGMRDGKSERRGSSSDISSES
jgi:hypothetical protein